ncbi:MAG: sigma-70 family RNA polymerase sigma factor [Planctomycetes bacterium]|nr:sigma-70 family RNA polymerase sigma factor [Planctomycetota bacterium]
MADPLLAEDLAQEALEVGLRTQMGTVANPKGWFAGVVRNLLRQNLRSNRRREQRERKTAISSPATSPPSGTLVERVELQQKVAAAVLGLPHDQRDVLILRYYEQQSVAQIAEAFGISENAAGLRIHRAKAMLRSQLQSSLGSDWRMLAIPISTGVTKVSLATAATSVFAMNNSLKIALTLAAVLVCSIPFWNNDNPAADASSEALNPALLVADSTPATLDSNSTEFEVGTTLSPLKRTQAEDEIILEIVDVNGNSIPHAEVHIFEMDYPFQTKRISRIPTPRFYGEASSSEGIANDLGQYALPALHPQKTTLAFARADGYVLRGVVVKSKDDPNQIQKNAIKIVLHDGAGEMTLQFVDDSGTPVPNIEAYAKDFSKSREGGELLPPGTVSTHQLITSSDGIAKFTNLPTGDLSFGIYQGNYLQWQEQIPVSSSPNLNVRKIVLDSGRKISVQVKAIDGSPIEGAEVYFSNSEWVNPVKNLRKLSGSFRGLTDAKGQLTIGGLSERGRNRIYVVREASWIDAPIPPDVNELTVRLSPSFHVKATFITADGNPAMGAKVSFIETTHPTTIPDQYLELGESGALDVPLMVGQYRFEATHPMGGIQSAESIQVDKDLDLGVIKIADGPQLNVTIVDELTGKPIDNATTKFKQVYTQGMGTGPDEWKRMLAAARSNVHWMIFSEGSFQTKALFPGIHTFVTTAPGYTSKETTLELVAGNQQDHTIALRPSCNLSLEVRFSDGSPANNRAFGLAADGLSIFGGDRAARNISQFRTFRTNADGKIEIKDLLPGVWNLEPGRQCYWGLSLKELSLTYGANFHVITIPELASVGCSVTENGQPAQDAKIWLSRAIDNPRSPYSFWQEAETEIDGIAKFNEVFPGKYQFTVSLGGHQPVQQIVTIGEGEVDLETEFRGIPVQGIVQNSVEGTWVVLASVKQASKTRRSNTEKIQATFSDVKGINWPFPTQESWDYGIVPVLENGTFSMTAPASGEYLIMAWNESEPLQTPEAVTIPEGGKSDLVISLTKASSIRITVIGLNKLRRQLNKAIISVNYESGNSGIGVPFSSFAENSTKILRGIQPGEGKLDFMLLTTEKNYDYRILASSIKDFNVTAGEQIEITFDASEFDLTGN